MLINIQSQFNSTGLLTLKTKDINFNAVNYKQLTVHNCLIKNIEASK